MHRPPSLRRTGLRRAAACLALLWAAPAAAQPSENAVKAAFLTKFPAYVDWPASLRIAPGAPINLCILGGDPFGRTIDEAARGQQVDGHPIAIRRMAGAAGAEICQIAFVDGDSAHGTGDMLRALQGRPVLTVTDGRDGPERGMIHFVVAGGRVRFHIDQAAAESCGLTFNARLLAIALSVRTGR
ncbi:MAG TPA: YfiR family protein [Allosphingosinicella sp.]|nr:YfiR family protein [Allosphingosinicella sp.]